MGLFKKTKQEEPLDRRRVLDLAASQMRFWDQDAKETGSTTPSAELRKVKAEMDQRAGRASKRELEAAYKITARNGYLP